MILKSAIKWQNRDGRIIDPFERIETPTTSRFIGALSFLIDSGENFDLIDICSKSMNTSSKELYYSFKKPIVGPEFYVKELVRGYLSLKNKVDEKLVKKLERYIGNYDPEKTYTKVLSKCKKEQINNFITFALAGEQYKKFAGLSENTKFIEKYLKIQKDRFTKFGMYIDPNAPMAYDWTSRMNLSLLLFFGYKEKHYEFYNETLRRGGITTLFFVSPNGEAPYGGRSNQYNFNEITLALICEFEANRYKKKEKLNLLVFLKGLQIYYHFQL